jgi:NAD(P)-dependent dehydrogenase (short-subunit alcohol dehydrogenase family)
VSSSAVVTGAAMGIGREVAAALLAEGRIVVGLDIDEGALALTAAELGPSFVTVVGDVAEWSSHERAADAAQARAPLRAWVNNAAVNIGGAAHEVTAAAIDAAIGVLQVGAMAGTAVAVRRMLALPPHEPGGQRGAIVNVSSIQAAAAFPSFYAYGAAKAAIAALARSVAVDYGPSGIRCNSVLPGTIETPMMHRALGAGWTIEDARRDAADLAPLGRAGEAAEVATVVAFLLSDRASYVSGVALPVDGATSARVKGPSHQSVVPDCGERRSPLARRTRPTETGPRDATPS